VRESWRGLALVAGGLSAALLVKGVFVALTLAGAGLWILIDPAQGRRLDRRLVIALAAGTMVTIAVGVGYELWFRAITGGPYWLPYLQRQLGQVDVAGGPVGGGLSALGGNLFFYLNRLTWHAAPWSLALAALAWIARSTWRSRWNALPMAERRGLLFALMYGVVLVVLLSPSSRVAERYIFSGTYVVAAAGCIVALRLWPRLGAWCRAIDLSMPAAPALLWLALMLGRLAIGPLIPRM
jgi:hypothetical protein